MNRRLVTGLITASGLALVVASSLWLREVRQVSREDPFGLRPSLQQLRLTSGPLPKPVRVDLQWKDPAIDQQKKLEEAARAMILH